MAETCLDLDDPALIPVRRRVIREKPFLRRIYDEWYAAIAAALPDVPGMVLEIGAGGGFLRDVIPGVIASELQPCAHVDVVLDGQELPLRAGSLRAIVMTDVLHHLPDAPRFLREAARCVRPRGRIVMIEPWVSAWSSFVYTRFHHEPFLPQAPDWQFARGGPLSASNMALPWIMFVRDRARFEREFPEWRVVSLRPCMPFRYLLSGGFTLRGLMPAWTFPAWRELERVLSPFDRQLAMFAQIVLERRDAGLAG
jgi:SAM-dependent methyltransferase